MTTPRQSTNVGRLLHGLLWSITAIFMLGIFWSRPPVARSLPIHEERANLPRKRERRNLASDDTPKAQERASKALPLKSSLKPDLILPALDHHALLSSARNEEKKGRFFFAVARETPVAPHLDGHWQVEGDHAHWCYHLRSIGAHSLNLAFSEFHLPAAATLTLSDPSGRASPIVFTARDNDDHDQLWTPVFETDELMVTLDLPTALASDLRLRLAKTNHAFRPTSARKWAKAIGDSTSGSCNLDVVCTAADDPNFGPLVDLFRDQIRSVAAYTLGGVETCSGALINNTRNDLTPYFLTADHCGINASNAPSIVVYWNFENSTCRTPNSSNSGANGDGPVTQFNSGSILRASRSTSDFCLIELDDPVDHTFAPFYAGWDRRGGNPATSVGIHHPGVSEKRISFELDPTRTTFYGNDSADAGGTHLRVSDWDFGTTEGGSSGSPLFDGSGRIVGQLHGGEAACGNDLPDWYGRFSRSWADGASAASRLADWLDPRNTGTLALEGINSEPILSAGEASLTEGDEGPSTVEITITLSEPSEEPVLVTLRSQEGSATATDFTPIDQMLTFSPGETSQTIPVSVTGDLLPEEHESFFLILSNPENAVADSQPGRVTILNDDFIVPEIDSPATVEAAANSLFEFRISARHTPTSFGLADGPAGMVIDPLTGVLSWNAPRPGTATVTLIATNPAGSDSQTLTITISPNDLMIALELNETTLISNHSPGWSLQTETTFDGTDAARADAVENSESAAFSLELTGPDLLEYHYKVSSEENFDFLTVSLDGEERVSFSGEIDWQQNRLIIPEGPHTLTFQYSKDGSISEGRDRAWVDAFSLASATGRPALVSPSELTLEAGQDFSYLIESISPEATFTVSSLPAGLTFDGLRTISGRLNTPGNESFNLTARANGREERLTVTLRIASPVGPSVELTSLPWDREGERIWFGQSAVTFDGIDAAQSGPISDSQSSTMSITVTGPDRLSFQWKVSSEEEFDELAFLFDGEVFGPVAPISGEQDWTPVNVAIPAGTHRLSWRYSKDGSVSEGEDAGWLDDFRLASGARPLVWSPASADLVAGVYARIPLEFVNTDLFALRDLPGWLTYREDLEALVGTAPVAGSFPISASATGNGETTTRVLLLVARPRAPALAAALGQSDLAVTTRGDAPWVPETDPTSARSGLVTDSETSALTLFLQGPGTVRFRWMVSSEEDFDVLRYSLNGTEMSRISGEVEWEELELALPPGRNQITWTYQKDESVSMGRDLGRVANVTLGGYARFLSTREVDHYSSGPDDDPDGNGLSLLHEYAFPTEPGRRAQSEPLRFLPATGQSGEALLEFTGLLPGSGVAYLIETSTTLARTSWQPLEEPLQIIPGEGRARYQLTTPVPSTGQSPRFFRVQARFD